MKLPITIVGIALAATACGGSSHHTASAGGSGGFGKAPGDHCEYKFSPGEATDANTRRLHCHHIYLPGEGNNEMHEYTSAPDPGAAAKAKYVRDVDAISPAFREMFGGDSDLVDIGLGACQDFRNNVPEAAGSTMAAASAVGKPMTIEQATAFSKAAHDDLCPSYHMVITS